MSSNLTALFPRFSVIQQTETGHRNNNLPSASLVVGENDTTVFALPLQLFTKPKANGQLDLYSNPYETPGQDYGNGNFTYKLMTDA